MTKPGLSLGRRVGYALGTAGIELGSVPITLLLLFYLTEVLGLRPAIAGVVVGLPKVWDMIVDPWLGRFIDRTSRRLGRRSPLLFVSATAFVIALELLFCLPSANSPAATAVMATALLIVISVAQTGFGVSRLALGDDMTADAGQRTSLFAYGAVAQLVMGIPATAAVPLLVSAGGGGHAGYRLMVNVVAGSAAIVLLLFLAATKDYRTAGGARQEDEAPLLKSVWATRNNPGFLYLMAFLVLFFIASAILGAFLPFANQHVLHADAASLSILGTVSLVTGLASIPLAATAAKHYGNAIALRIGGLVMSASFLLLYAASFGPNWMSWAAVGAFGLGAGGMGILLQSAIIDVAKVQLQGGRVLPLGMYLGILFAGSKLGQSLGSAVAGFLLDVIGFVPGAAEQNASTLTVLRMGYTLVPCVLIFIGTCILWRIRDGMSQALAGQSHSAADPA